MLVLGDEHSLERSNLSERGSKTSHRFGTMLHKLNSQRVFLESDVHGTKA